MGKIVIYVDMAMRFRLKMVIAIVAIIGSTTLSHPPSPLRPKKTNPEDQINKKLSELSLFLVANSKREHTSDDINLMTLYMFANYINISQKL